MITPDQIEWLKILGSDTLREYRDAIIEILAVRDVASDNVERSNVKVVLQHRPDLGNHNRHDPNAYRDLIEFVLHPTDDLNGNGVLINREGTRDHLWIEARWL